MKTPSYSKVSQKCCHLLQICRLPRSHNRGSSTEGHTSPTSSSSHDRKERSHLELEAREVLSHKRRLRRQYIATGDPSIKQLYSSTTNRPHRLLARTRRENLDTLLEGTGPDNNSNFSLWRLTRGIKRQLFQSPVLSHSGLWLKTDVEKARAFA